MIEMDAFHCVKSVQIRRFFLVRIFLYSVQIQENAGQKKLSIWTFLKQLADSIPKLQLNVIITAFISFSSL